MKKVNISNKNLISKISFVISQKNLFVPKIRKQIFLTAGAGGGGAGA